MDPADLAFLIAGAAALLAGLLPRLLEGRPLSLPIAFLGLGMLVFTFASELPVPDPLRYPGLAEHLTEIGVIVALMGAGLKLDRPVGWHRWSATWRLLAAMPIMILATALLGWWWLGLAPAAAALLGAALAPTDPVLASDVQVGEPSEDEDSEDEVRFALTSEAGLNDALAFPFVYAAIAMATAGTNPARWLLHLLSIEVAYKIAVGVVLGIGTGWVLGKLFFRPRRESLRLAKHSEGFVALAATFLAYGLTEVVNGYGFLAVFLCACAIRAAERTHRYQQVLHDFTEQTERLLTVLLLVLLGGAVVGGLLAPLTWEAAALGLVLLVLIRPITAWLSLTGSGIGLGQRGVISVFGIRGISSLYYMAYAAGAASFSDTPLLWAIVGFVVVVSVVGHGVTATPVMQRIDRKIAREGAG